MKQMSEENANLIKRIVTTIALTVLVLGISFYGGYKAGQAAKISENAPDKTELQEMVYKKIADAADSAVSEFSFTNVLTGGDIIKYDGTLTAGPELLKMQVEVDVANKIIRILLPEAKMLSCTIDEKSIEKLDASGRFSAFTPADMNAFKAEQKAACEKAAADKGFLDKSYDSAKRVLTDFRKSLNAAADYVIEYRK